MPRKTQEQKLKEAEDKKAAIQKMLGLMNKPNQKAKPKAKLETVKESEDQEEVIRIGDDDEESEYDDEEEQPVVAERLGSLEKPKKGGNAKQTPTKEELSELQALKEHLAKLENQVVETQKSKAERQNKKKAEREEKEKEYMERFQKLDLLLNDYNERSQRKAILFGQIDHQAKKLQNACKF